MHQDQPTAARRREIEHAIVLETGGDVVDRMGARIERSTSDVGASRIHGDDHIRRRTKAFDHRADASNLFVGVDAFRAGMLYCGHLDAVKPALTVAENLAFWARLRGGGGVGDALAAFGIAHLADVPARFLSAGQRRRLGLARLLAAPAKLWLLDEPTVSLDRESVAALEAIIADHRNAGGAVIAATHIDLGLDGAAVLAFGHGRHGGGGVADHDLAHDWSDETLHGA